MTTVMGHRSLVKEASRRKVHRKVTAGSEREFESRKKYRYHLELKTALQVCESINTPRSLAVWYLLKERSSQGSIQYLSLPPPVRPAYSFQRAAPRTAPRELVSHASQAFSDLATARFADDYLVTEMMSKNVVLPTDINRQAVALESFHEAERKNLVTNNRILSWYGSHDPNLSLITKMRAIIRKILGPLNLEKLRFVEDSFRFGPGATSAVSGADVLLSKKYAVELHATPRLCPFVRSVIGSVWGSFPGTDLILNDSSHTKTVTKNAKTDRLIAIEPHLNIFVQLGIGALIRRCLRRFGVDLETQDWNQFLASVADEWSLSTLDLKGASNSVVHRLVKLLLPHRWYELLYLARSDFTIVDGKRVPLQMFSSMGNGYTFELETLIFYAACIACGSHPSLTAVYGDDIIVERTTSLKLIDLLNQLGFEVNEKKTFLSGNFFESCGTDWFNGVNVRPFYFKGDYNDDTECRLFIPNALRRYAHRRNHFRSCSILFKKTWVSAIRRLTPLERRTAIPTEHGDDGLVRNLDESASLIWYSKDYQNWCGRVLPLRPVRSHNGVVNGSYLAALHKGASDSPKSVETQRGRTVRSKGLRARTVFNWYDLGPWC